MPPCQLGTGTGRRGAPTAEGAPAAPSRAPARDRRVRRAEYPAPALDEADDPQRRRRTEAGSHPQARRPIQDGSEEPVGDWEGRRLYRRIDPRVLRVDMGCEQDEHQVGLDGGEPERADEASERRVCRRHERLRIATPGFGSLRQTPHRVPSVGSFAIEPRAVTIGHDTHFGEAPVQPVEGLDQVGMTNGTRLFSQHPSSWRHTTRRQCPRPTAAGGRAHRRRPQSPCPEGVVVELLQNERDLVKTRAPSTNGWYTRCADGASIAAGLFRRARVNARPSSSASGFRSS